MSQFFHRPAGRRAQPLQFFSIRVAFIAAAFLALLFLTVVPAAAGEPHAACSICHIRSDSIVQPVSTGRSVKKDCVECHADVLQPHASNAAAGWRRTAPMGGKTIDELTCLSCHTQHFEGQPKLLRLESGAAPVITGAVFDKETRSCLNCHPLGAEFRGFGRHYIRHPVGIAVRKPGVDRSQLPPLFDVRGTEDPSDDVIGCGTCHLPHTSKNSFLLRWSLSELPAACLKCHPDVAPSTPETTKGLLVRR